MYIPSTTPVETIDTYMLPNAVATNVINRNYAAVKSYVISNPQIIQQLSLVNRAFRSSYTFIGNGGCGSNYNIPYTSVGNVVFGVDILTLNPQQCYQMYRYTANARMTNSNLSYLMHVAFGIDNQMKTAKRTILRNGDVCVNCDLLPIIENPVQLTFNDSAHVLKFMLDGRGTTCVSGDFYNLECGGDGQAI